MTCASPATPTTSHGPPMGRRERPKSQFERERGAERMRQSWARARGLNDSDKAVLGTVHVLCIGWSKTNDTPTLAAVASELGRWERPQDDDPRSKLQIERARTRVTDRIGQSLQRLHNAGAVIYRPGRGGRRSAIELPEMADDQSQPHDPRGVDRRGDSISTPRVASVNPTDRVRQPHAARGVRPIEPIGPIGPMRVLSNPTRTRVSRQLRPPTGLPSS